MCIPYLLGLERMRNALHANNAERTRQDNIDMTYELVNRECKYSKRNASSLKFNRWPGRQPSNQAQDQVSATFLETWTQTEATQ